VQFIVRVFLLFALYRGINVNCRERGTGLGATLNPKLRFFLSPERDVLSHLNYFPIPGEANLTKKLWKNWSAAPIPLPPPRPSVQTLITAGVFCISCIKFCLQFWRQFFLVLRWSSLQFISIFSSLLVLVFRLYFAIVFTTSPRFARFALILFTRIVKNSRLKGAYYFHKPTGWNCYA